MNQVEQLEREITHRVGRCIADFDLIADGDRIMVCASGGKDSYALLQVLDRLRRAAPIHFELLAVHLDQGQPGHDPAPLEAWLRDHGFTYHILREDTYRIVKNKVEPGGTFCALCSRLRRGVLYNAAVRLQCNKIALGHNREDTIETLLLNLIFAGSLKAMPPKLVSDDRRNVVIRPLLYADEDLMTRYAEASGFPLLPCGLCGSPQAAPKRAQVKQWLAQLESLAPGAKASILAATRNVLLSHLLDRDLYPALYPDNNPVTSSKGVLQGGPGAKR